MAGVLAISRRFRKVPVPRGLFVRGDPKRRRAGAPTSRLNDVTARHQGLSCGIPQDDGSALRTT